MNTPHPEPEVLAELAGATLPTALTTRPDADVAAADEATAADAAAEDARAEDARAAAQPDVLAHVAECSTCRADLEAFRRMRDLLHSLPPVPMPADVAERLDAALSAARTPVSATGDVVPLKERAEARTPRWKSFPVGVAAGVIVIVAVGVVVVGGLNRDGGTKNSTSTTAGGAAGSRTIASGIDYTTGSLRGQVAGLVNTEVPGAATQFPGVTNPEVLSFGAASASSSAAGPQAQPPVATPSATALTTDGHALSAPKRTAASGPLADPAALQRCIVTLLNKAEEPVLVDYATYNGAPATIIVLPDPDEARKLDIYVIADTADCAKEQLTTVAFLPPPAP